MSQKQISSYQKELIYWNQKNNLTNEVVNLNSNIQLLEGTIAELMTMLGGMQ